MYKYDQYDQQNLDLNGTNGPSLAAIDWRNQELMQAYNEANVNLDDWILVEWKGPLIFVYEHNGSEVDG